MIPGQVVTELHIIMKFACMRVTHAGDTPVLGYCRGVGTASSLQASSHASTTEDTMPDDKSQVRKLY